MTDTRDWKPVLRGKIYCAPACGAKCTKAAFDRANRRAAELSAYLGRRWKAHIWENLGWHFDVSNGSITVREYLGKFRATLTVSVTHDDMNGTPQFFCTHRDARRAVAEVIGRFDKYIETVVQARNKIKV